MNSSLALDIRGLQKTYANGFEALKGVDVDVEPGEFFALLGPNGAGKSTLIGIVSGLVNRSGGSVDIFGHDISRNPGAAKPMLGVVPQELNMNQFDSPLNIVVNQAGYYGIGRRQAVKAAEWRLDELGLWDKRSDRVRELSGGMKRRLMIARALVHDPKLLILDEPTAGVDIELRRSMWTYLRDVNETGTTIILTTHYLEEAESLCRSIAIIDHGRIVEDTLMKDLLNQLHVETFVFDLAQPTTVADMPEFPHRQLDATTIEVDIDKAHGLNELFARFAVAGVEVSSMRNKANRLEEVFVRLVGNGGDDAGKESSSSSASGRAA